MSIKDKIDNTLIDLETRFQKARNDIAKIGNLQPSERSNMQNEIKKQIDAIHGKIIELKVSVKSLPPSQKEYYKEEVKNFFTQHQNLVSEFKKTGLLPTPPPPGPRPTPMEQKSQEIIKTLDDTIQITSEMVSRKLDKKVKKVETNLQRARNDLDRLDQCLPSQRINFQTEIQKQLDEIQRKIDQIYNTTRSLSPKEALPFNNKANLLSQQREILLSDLKNKETPTTVEYSIKQLIDPNVTLERNVI